MITNERDIVSVVALKQLMHLNLSMLCLTEYSLAMSGFVLIGILLWICDIGDELFLVLLFGGLMMPSGGGLLCFFMLIPWFIGVWYWLNYLMVT